MAQRLREGALSPLRTPTVPPAPQRLAPLNGNKTVVVAGSYQRAAIVAKRLARETGGRLVDYVQVSTQGDDRPCLDGLLPERVVYVDGWLRGERAHYITRRLEMIAAKRPFATVDVEL